MSKICIGSDFHFNHGGDTNLTGILKHTDRPFANVTEMNEHMISAWNEVVGVNDLIYVLGDFAYPPKNQHHVTFDELAARLNGRKILVIGNHDRETMKDGIGPKAKDHWMWEEAVDYVELKFGKDRFVFSHYPFETWRNAHHGWYHCHGHSHGTLKRVIPHRMDVGVDCMPNWGPVPLEYVRDIFAAQEDYKPEDHHGD